MTLPLDLHFTDPVSPLFIDIEGDNFESLFVISTSQVIANANSSVQSQSTTGQRHDNVNRKRVREDDSDNPNDADNQNIPKSRPTEKERIKKPMKAVKRLGPTSVAHAQAHASTSSRPGTVRGSMPPPSSIPFRPLSQTPVFSHHNGDNHRRDPLFLPGSQLSTADEEAIRDSGLGIENMGADELEALLEGDGEEVGFDFGSQRMLSQPGIEGLADGNEGDAMQEDEDRGGGDSFDVIEDMELEATQADGGTKVFSTCALYHCLGII